MQYTIFLAFRTIPHTWFLVSPLCLLVSIIPIRNPSFSFKGDRQPYTQTCIVLDSIGIQSLCYSLLVPRVSPCLSRYPTSLSVSFGIQSLPKSRPVFVGTQSLYQSPLVSKVSPSLALSLLVPKVSTSLYQSPLVSRVSPSLALSLLVSKVSASLLWHPESY